MPKQLFWVLLVAVVGRPVFAQDTRQARVKIPRTNEERNVEILEFKLASLSRFPDYSGDRILELLAVREVRKEIQLSDVDYLFIKRVRDDCSRQCVAVGLKYANVPSGYVERDIEIASIRALAKDSIYQRLTVPQEERLRQLTYHFEIEFYGFGRALCEGELGKQIGVSDNQFTHLEQNWLKRESGYREKIKAFRLRCHEEILKSLPREQQTRITSVLGSYFDFWDTMYCQARQQVALEQTNSAKDSSQSVRTIIEIDYRQLDDFVWALGDKDIAHELALDERQKRVIADFLQRTRRPSKDGRDLEAQVGQMFDEILTPNQLERVRQLGHYLEIASKGYGIALTSGFLGREIGIKPDQYNSLQTTCEFAEENCEKAGSIEYNNLLITFMRELSAEQRDAANKCLGKSFHCPTSVFGARREQLFRAQQEMESLAGSIRQGTPQPKQP